MERKEGAGDKRLVLWKKDESLQAISSLLHISVRLTSFLQELQSRAAKLPDPGKHTHTLSLPGWEPQDPHCDLRSQGEAAALGLGCRQERTGLPGALPGPQWEGARVGLQLGEAQSPCLGPSFFLPSTRKKSAQSSGSEGACITAVGTGVILDVPRGAKT